jgi:hypothetical protein
VAVRDYYFFSNYSKIISNFYSFRRIVIMKSITTQAAEEVYLHSKRVFSLFILTLLLFSSFLILNQNAEAQLFCPMSAIDQITDETAGNSSQTSINADGRRITFTSDANIGGGNPEGNFEIYLFDTVAGIITQITDETAGASLVGASTSINADGTRIAFTSDANIGGGNPEGNFEIYLFDTATGIITQITDETAGISADAVISGDGTRIAFESNADINMGNPDGNAEVYLIVCFDPPAHPDPVRMGSNRYGGSIGDSRIYGYEKKESNFLID